MAVPPAIIKFPESAEVVEGGSVEFSCIGTGKPEPETIWYLNGMEDLFAFLINVFVYVQSIAIFFFGICKDNLIVKNSGRMHYELLKNGQILRVHNIMRGKDDGVYLCAIENFVGRTQVTASLQIYPPGEPYEGRIAMFMCAQI